METEHHLWECGSTGAVGSMEVIQVALLQPQGLQWQGLRHCYLQKPCHSSDTQADNCSAACCFLACNIAGNSTTHHCSIPCSGAVCLSIAPRLLSAVCEVFMVKSTSKLNCPVEQQLGWLGWAVQSADPETDREKDRGRHTYGQTDKETEEDTHVDTRTSKLTYLIMHFIRSGFEAADSWRSILVCQQVAAGRQAVQVLHEVANDSVGAVNVQSVSVALGCNPPGCGALHVQQVAAVHANFGNLHHNRKPPNAASKP